MRTQSFFALLLLLCSACNKESNSTLNSARQNSNSIRLTDTVKVPITDLGTGTYRGFTGGLYPGGVNTPSGAYGRDLRTFASNIAPLNSMGIKDSTAKGKIGFISLGGSTCGDLFIALKNKTYGNPATNSFLHLVNCANGGGKGSINSIMNLNDPYWDHVNSVLRTSFISDNQVQVIYIDTEDSTSFTAFPGRPHQYRDEFEAAMRVCKAKFINLKLVYMNARTTTFNKKEIPNKEPCPYYNGWGQKFAIEDQINGVPGTKYKGLNPVAPLFAWGWYQWADGTTTPRQDGFVWTRSMTTDGLHATDEGLDTLSNRFQNFLFTDRAASIWYANHAQPK